MREYQYYYGNDAENFNFFRLPKKLIRDRQYRGLSSDAKILYGLLLDRMALSARNGWLDDMGRIYIIFTIQEIAEELYCSKRKAIQLMNELDKKTGIGLVERVRRGMGKPNIIYVKNFNTEDIPEQDGKTGSYSAGNKANPGTYAGEDKGLEKIQEEPVRGSRALQEVQERAPQEVQGCTLQEVQRCAPQEVQERALQEVQGCVPQNNTDMNDTEYIYNNLSIHLSDDHKDGWMDRRTVMRILGVKLGYSRLVKDMPMDADQIREIIGLLADVCCYDRQYVEISGSSIPIDDVRDRIMSLNSEHVLYVLSRLKNNTGKVKNIRGYLLACLYNAPVTMKSFYQAEVQGG